MAPSASKQKRLAEKAAKNSSSSKTTPSVSKTGTPLTSLSANGSNEDLSVLDAQAAMAKLNTAQDR